MRRNSHREAFYLGSVSLSLPSSFVDGASVLFDPLAERVRANEFHIGRRDHRFPRRRPTAAVAAAAAAVRGAMKEVGARTFKSKNGRAKLPTPGVIGGSRNLLLRRRGMREENDEGRRRRGARGGMER